MGYHIYSLEDDKDIARIINLTLTKQGYEVTTFYDAASFKAAFSKNRPDMILLDLMLPDANGLDLLKEIRSNPLNNDIQILIVSAKSQIMDKVDGLDLGADDYIEKPFDILELISRVNAKARRYLSNQNLVIGNVSLNNLSHICKVKGQEVDLTQTEFIILYYLMKNSGGVVSRDDILKALWGDEEALESRTIDVHINALRKKLGDDGNRIVAVYGIGYRYLP
ncbi:MAG: response regulator transcription factor [Bacilli bacterium]|jgi:two-component system alkaline phosphatase synthesis response regulator PhoP|nr:response regulator transcription factor [Bacilli bacterium]